MTLYVQVATKRDGRPVHDEASLFAKLTDRGWVTCERCEGDPHKIDRWTCPDCVDGLVPPEGMVEAAGRAAFQQRHPDGRWNRQRNFSKKKWCDTQRAALVAAARWEREQ